VQDADLTYVGGLSMGNGDPERRQAASRQLDAIRTMGAELIRGAAAERDD
jgi:NAD(P)H dehydrogenase (quinone)